MKKDKRKIPKGYYCYVRKEKGMRIFCPYWSIKKELPQQENGYCAYLEKSDYEINEKLGNIKFIDNQHKDTIIKYNAHDIKYSLLWDMVKTCIINVRNDVYL